MGIRRRISILMLIIWDYIFLLFSIYLTIHLRIKLNPLFERKFDFDTSLKLLPPFYFIALVFLFIFYLKERYTFIQKNTFLDNLHNTVTATFYSVSILMILSFLLWTQNFSRSLVILLWPVSIIIMTLNNFLLIPLLKFAQISGLGQERMAVLNPDEKVKKILQEIKTIKSSPFEIIGIITKNPPSNCETTAEHMGGLKYLGDFHNLTQIINEHMIDRILLPENALTPFEFYELIEKCDKMGVQVDKIPDFASITERKLTLNQIGGYFVISIRKRERKDFALIIKRFIDLTVSGVILIILSPLLGMISIIVKLDSKGPILFKQKRMGKGGKNFYFIKFRSMKVGADEMKKELMAQNESDGLLFKIKEDPRVTRVGKFLRKFSLDELPSLLNVLPGKMSLVGPRPLPYEDLKRAEEIEEYRIWLNKRTEVLPGITGLWQISGRSDLSFKDMMKLDLYYVANWNLWLDFKILLKTIPFVIKGKGAY